MAETAAQVLFLDEAVALFGSETDLAWAGFHGRVKGTSRQVKGTSRQGDITRNDWARLLREHRLDRSLFSPIRPRLGEIDIAPGDRRDGVLIKIVEAVPRLVSLAQGIIDLCRIHGHPAALGWPDFCDGLEPVTGLKIRLPGESPPGDRRNTRTLRTVQRHYEKLWKSGVI
jgi:hypothetical protein